ncbi:MAG: hypothetical protein RL685_4073 [Pseudomonadota bacterium]
MDVEHFLSLRDWGAVRISQTLDRAEALARLWKSRQMPQPLQGKRIALWFYGDGFRNRLAFELGATTMGASIAYMPGELGVHEPIEDVAGYLANWFDLLVLRAKNAAGEIRVTHDLEGALVQADVIYTDCWPSAATAEERAQIRERFLPYQIGERQLSALAEDGVFLPCPPVTRGEEVSAAALLSPRCQNHAAKDDLLHVQNAILEAMVG